MFKIKSNSIEVVVRVKQKKTNLLGWNEKKNAYDMDVSAPAENNKANEAIIRYLEKKTEKKAKIIKGKTSKRKIIRFD